MRKRYDYFYRRHGLKHVTGFITADELTKLKALAKASDKSVTRYVTRLIQKHLQDTHPAAKMH